MSLTPLPSVIIAAHLTSALLPAGAACSFMDLSFKEAMKLAVKEDKAVMVEFEAQWCQVCKMMEKETFSDDLVEAALGEIIAIRVDVDTAEGRELARENGITALPTLLFISPQGDRLASHIGFMDPGQFLSMVEQVRGEYKRGGGS